MNFSVKDSLVKLPDLCLVSELHLCFAQYSDVMRECLGRGADEIMARFSDEQERDLLVSGRGVMFSREGARIWQDRGEWYCNPRDIVFGMWLAMLAIRESGLGSRAGVVGGDRQLERLVSPEYLTWVVLKRECAIYPMLEWRDANFSGGQQKAVVAGIRNGRDQISNRDLASESEL